MAPSNPSRKGTSSGNYAALSSQDPDDEAMMTSVSDNDALNDITAKDDSSDSAVAATNLQQASEKHQMQSNQSTSDDATLNLSTAAPNRDSRSNSSTGLNSAMSQQQQRHHHHHPESDFEMRSMHEDDSDHSNNAHDSNDTAYDSNPEDDEAQDLLQGHHRQYHHASPHHHDPLHHSLLQEGLKLRLPANLDVFFEMVYGYYNEKGWVCLLLRRIYDLTMTGVTILLSCFLFLFMNWSELLRCDLAECAQVSLVTLDAIYNPMHLTYLIIFALHGVLFVFWCGYLVRCASQMYHYLEIRHFFNHDLNIKDSELQYMKWGELVELIIHFHETQARISISELSAKVIASRIMRKDNYLIAFLNQDVINLRLFSFTDPILSETLLWNLRLIIQKMFKGFSVDNDMLRHPGKLRRLFITCGVLNLILTPFIFFFVVMRGIFKYAAMMHKSKGGFLVERKWSRLAEWTFRDFNELPHQLEDRMNQAYKPAERYMSQFPNYMLSLMAKVVMTVSSALAASIILLSFIKNPLLIHVQVMNYNLLSWLAILLLAWSVARGFVIERYTVFDPNAYMSEIVRCTYYLPEEWKDRAHTKQVYTEFQTYFQPTFKGFLQELLSIFTTPFMLIFILPKSARKIVEFVDSVTIEDGVGHVCGLATFKFDKFEASNEQSTKRRDPSFFHAGDDRDVEEQKIPISKPLMDKMERSFLRFKSSHPLWKSDQSGEAKAKELTQSMMSGGAYPAIAVEGNLSQPATAAQSNTDRPMVASASASEGQSTVNNSTVRTSPPDDQDVDPESTSRHYFDLLQSHHSLARPSVGGPESSLMLSGGTSPNGRNNSLNASTLAPSVLFPSTMNMSVLGASTTMDQYWRRRGENEKL